MQLKIIKVEMSEFGNIFVEDFNNFSDKKISSHFLHDLKKLIDFGKNRESKKTKNSLPPLLSFFLFFTFCSSPDVSDDKISAVR